MKSLLTYVVLYGVLIVVLLHSFLLSGKLPGHPTTKYPASSNTSNFVDTLATLKVDWEGTGVVIINIEEQSIIINTGQIQIIRIKPNVALRLVVVVETPSNKYYASDYLMIAPSGGDLKIGLSDEKVIFEYKTPEEKNVQVKLEKEEKELEERRNKQEEEERSIREAELSKREAQMREEKRQLEERILAMGISSTVIPVIENILSNMIWVEGGTFTMGCTAEQGGNCESDEKPAHNVTLSSFYISKFEVTQAQWTAIMGKNPSYFNNCGDDCPVEKVSWKDVQMFLEKLNTITGKQYRLPTEAEWEYAARGGNKSKGYKYSGSNNLNDVAWYDGNSGNKTHAVGGKLPNELGLYDMCGNVEEWCSDWYGSKYYVNSLSNNPQGPSSGFIRILRGGSWFYLAETCRVAQRCHFASGFRYYTFGFRLVLSE